MVPVSVLPAAGIMVAIGRLLTDFSHQENTILFHVGKTLYSSGLVIFEQLALIFAVGVAIAFSGSAGIAGLAAVTGYFAFTAVLKSVGELMNLHDPINTGVLGGICVGFLVAFLYNRFHQVKLNPVLGFFSGKRLVPILAVFFSVMLAFVFCIFWPPIQNGIHAFGISVMGNPFGPSIYASVKRLLIPVGLHHVFYPSFLYEFGEFVTTSGKVVRGETTRYFAGDPSAGHFMASEFPLMLFGLPAAALAMWARAKPEKKKAIAGIMLSAALTSIVTGITEPIEFAFVFIAPLLYLLHVALAFFSGYLTTLFDIHLGYTFSASAIDLVLGYFNQKNISLLFFVVGPIVGVSYFCVFYWAIGFFNFKTPGREDEAQAEEVNAEEVTDSRSAAGLTQKATKVLEAIGGKENLTSLDACITRLRLIVKNDELVDRPALKKLGASGVMNAGGGNVQIVFGVESDFLKIEMQKQIAEMAHFALTSPLSGKVVALDQIPDETFASEMMGKTIAILPTSSQVVSPFDGEVMTLFHTHHAIGLLSNDGVELLIHVGIDTVKMNGEGFVAKVSQGDRVVKGQVLIEFDSELIRKKAKSLITPLVITNTDSLKGLESAVSSGQKIKAGEKLWKWF